jgi:uncharacterized membrane protein YbaN (DUF454 family)
MRFELRLPRFLWLIMGFLFVGLGIAGFILPMMPGLVFFILASFCFAKSSPRLLRRILAHPQIGPQIMDWKRGKGMRLKTKVLAIVMVTLSLTFSAFFLVKPVWVKWIIMVSMVGINAYILSVKTRKPQPRLITLPKQNSHARSQSHKDSSEVFEPASKHLQNK